MAWSGDLSKIRQCSGLTKEQNQAQKKALTEKHSCGEDHKIEASRKQKEEKIQTALKKEEYIKESDDRHKHMDEADSWRSIQPKTIKTDILSGISFIQEKKPFGAFYMKKKKKVIQKYKYSQERFQIQLLLNNQRARYERGFMYEVDSESDSDYETEYDY